MKNIYFLVSLLIFITSFAGISYSDSYYDALMKRAWDLRQEKKFLEAENIYRKLTTLNPKQENAWVGLLYTLNSMEKFKNAEKTADRLLIDYPQNIFVRKAAAWTYYNIGRYYDAAINYRYALDKTGEDDMRIGLGLSLRKIGKEDEAREICLKCSDKTLNTYAWKMCMGEKNHLITVTPSIYMNQMSYSGDSSKDISRSVSSTMDIFSDYGYGLFLSGRKLWYTLRENSGSGSELSSNISLYHASWDKGDDRYSKFEDPDSFIWFGWSRISPELDEDTGGDYYSITLAKRVQRFLFNFEYGLGEYDGFDTSQFAPSFSFLTDRDFRLNIKPVLLRAYGEKSDSQTEFKDRFSVEIGADYINDEKSLISFSFYKGERWFYSDKGGISVWTGDEVFDYGASLMIKGSYDIFSPFLKLSADHVKSSYGAEKDYSIAGVTFGLSFSF